MVRRRALGEVLGITRDPSTPPSGLGRSEYPSRHDRGVRELLHSGTKVERPSPLGSMLTIKGAAPELHS
eukprot:54664-Eustigmatos_ZCMA.PRE.1